MKQDIWIKLRLNPEPWAVGTIYRTKQGAGMSPNPNLVAFQKAVREELMDHKFLPDTYRKITFYFYRQQAQYLDMSDKIRSRNQADATNMQKALEDALQGVLFENDREVRDIRSVIVQQGFDVNPMILIRAEHVEPDQRLFELKALADAPKKILDWIFGGDKPAEKPKDKWNEAEDIF